MQLALHPGQVFAGEYLVVNLLCAGGMGAVYVAEQRNTGKRRALKIMHPELVREPMLRRRFEQEARVSSRIASDHVVEVVAAGVDEQTGLPFLVMELLVGEDLGRHLERRGMLPLPEAVVLFEHMTHVLAAAHAVGIVHRDLKPDNVFVTQSQRVGEIVIAKILDFGIAKVVAEASDRATAAVGTPFWMAPEQTRPSLGIGPPADVWALGLVMFRMLTGRLYWTSAQGAGGTLVEVLTEASAGAMVPASIRARELGAPGPLPAGFDDWFAGCVRADPAARFADASVARAAFRQCVVEASRLVSWSNRPAATRVEPSEVFASSPRVEVAAVASEAQTYRPNSPAQGPIATLTAMPATALVSPSWSPNSPSHSTQSVPPLEALSRAPVSGTTPPFALGYSPIPSAPPVASSKNVGLFGYQLAGLALGAVVVLVLVVGIATKVHRANALSKHVQKCESAAENAQAGNAAEFESACARACESNPIHCERHGDVLRKFGTGAGSAATAFRSACDSGNERSCGKLADALLEAGQAVPAFEIHSARCSAFVARSCAVLGLMTERGLGTPRDAAKAPSLYEKACRGQDALGCAYRALLLDSGRGVARDEASARTLAEGALSLLSAACDAGMAAECVALGSFHEAGLGTARDNSRAAGFYRKACEGGSHLGCTNLAALGIRGVGDARDPARAVGLLDKSCQSGEPGACTTLAQVRSKLPFVVRRGAGGVTLFKASCSGLLRVGCAGWGKSHEVPDAIPSEPKAAADLAEKACASGEQVACVNFGAYVAYGIGRPPNRGASEEFFRKACEAGNAGGCGELGSLYVTGGSGVAKDPGRGVLVLGQACDGGELDACVLVSSMQSSGIGVPKNQHVATSTVRDLCEGPSKVAFACHEYARYLWEGLGVGKDIEKATLLHRDVCSGKLDTLYPSSCTTLGSRHEQGDGVPKDATMAVEYYRWACNAKDSDGCVALARMLAEGTGVSKDTGKALSILDAQCKAQDGNSCQQLGHFYLSGKAGLTQDGARASEMYRAGCSMGNRWACVDLGVVLVRGLHGATKNKDEGIKLLREGCDQRIDYACKHLAQAQFY